MVLMAIPPATVMSGIEIPQTRTANLDLSQRGRVLRSGETRKTFGKPCPKEATFLEPLGKELQSEETTGLIGALLEQSHTLSQDDEAVPLPAATAD